MMHGAWWRWWWVAITIRAEEPKDLYQRLKNDPAIWGDENPAGLVALPCRKRRSVWNFQRCCARSAEQLAAMSDRELEEEFQECFQRGSAPEIRYALETCCDDRGAVLMSNNLWESYFDLAVCLSNCTPSDLSVAPDCGCEASFVKRALRHAQVPQKMQRDLAGWITRSKPYWEQQLRTKLLQTPKDFTEENLRFALRMLEHLIISPQLSTVPAPGEAMPNTHWSFPGASALHEGLTSKLLSFRPKKLRWLRTSSPSSSRRLPPVHLALIASVGEPPYGRQALATVRSALYFAKTRKLHFHIFVDNIGMADMEAAMRDHLEPWLRARISKVDYYGGATMKEVWPVVKRHVPASCMAHSREYGFPGWMRLFPHEVNWKRQIEHLIWVDAGDFIFFADPALLLEQHKEQVKRSNVVATYSKNQPWPLQVFSLQRMKEVGWTTMVGRFIGSEWKTNRSGDHGHLCFMAEGIFMTLIGRYFPQHFGSVADEWAHEPRLPFFNGVLQQPERTGGFRDSPSVWSRREHPGLIDPTRAFIFCPSYGEFWAHAVATMHYPFFMVEAAQVFERARLEISYMLMEGKYDESPNYGTQDLRCGRPVLGMHLIRQFHGHIPWSIRLLDFWSNATALWGKRFRNLGKEEPSEKRALPVGAHEVI